MSDPDPDNLHPDPQPRGNQISYFITTDLGFQLKRHKLVEITIRIRLTKYPFLK